MVFGENTLNRFKQRPRKSTVVFSLVVMGLICLSGWLTYSLYVSNARIAKLSSDLTSANATVASLTIEKNKLGAGKEIAESERKKCSVKLEGVESQIAAFAKQAAICDALRVKMKIKQQ